MTQHIGDKTVAFLAADGVEQVELDQPWEAVKAAGGSAVLVGVGDSTIQAFNHLDKAELKQANIGVAAANPEDFDALVLPGGVVNGDFVRAHHTAVGFVRAFVNAGKPIAAICHGAWVLVEADAVKGRTMTSYPSLQTDLRNAGAHWVDQEVVVDNGLVTSRNPRDLPAFCTALIAEIAAA